MAKLCHPLTLLMFGGNGVRSVKNVSNSKRHIVSTDKSGYTLCGKSFMNSGFTHPKLLLNSEDISCKSCSKLYKK